MAAEWSNLSLLTSLGAILVAISLVFLYWIYNYLNAPFQIFKQLRIKGPKPSIFYGNFKETQKLGVLKYFQSLHDKYGSVVGFYTGRVPILMITDVDMVKQITVKEFDSFMDRRLTAPDAFRPTTNSANGLLLSRGEVWKTSRKTLSPTFSAAKMKMMVPLIRNSTLVLSEKMKEFADRGSSVDVFKVFGAFTMETIVATAFGRVVDIQRGDHDELTNAAGELFRGADLLFVYYAQMILSNFPFLNPIVRMLVLRSSRGKAMKTLEEVALSLVKTRRESSHQGKYKDMLQLMLEASEEEGDEAQAKTSTANKKLSNEQIVAHSIGFLAAGYETTGNTLTYTAYLLALNPEVQERLQKEIDSYFEQQPEVGLYEATLKIGYLDMVIQESLRLYSPAQLINRLCLKTVTINDVTIPKGVTVIIPMSLLHKSPKYWKDPEVFRPERFTSEEKAKRPQLCYMPFGFGPRSCIGMRFAMLEAKLALIEVLRKFSFVRAPGTEVPLQTAVGVTMAPKNGVFLKIVPRD